MRRLAWLVLVPVVAGCSQIDALAPISGVPITTVTIAASDVLASEDVAMLTWPVCEPVNEGFTCDGTTTDDEPVKVEVTGDPMNMTVMVDGKSIFEGPVQTVIEKAGEQTL